MNEEFKRFIQEETKKLHTITLLEEAKRQVENELTILKEGGWSETGISAVKPKKEAPSDLEESKVPEKNSPEWHQIQIAKKTMKMTDVGASVMGGMNKSDAKKILDKYKIKY